MSTKIPRPVRSVWEILSPRARKLWPQIVALIPGFLPGIDDYAVGVYLNLLDRIAEAKACLAREDAPAWEKGFWQERLPAMEAEALEWAKELGLTPASRLEITRRLRRRRKQQGR